MKNNTPVVMVLGDFKETENSCLGWCLAHRCMQILEQFKISIKCIVGPSALKNICDEKYDFISNNVRNEQLILDTIKKYAINMLISINHYWILPEKILNAVNDVAFNVHNGRLPDYRGYNILTHSILNNETTHTTTIHYMAAKVDMGNIICTQNVKITEDDTARSLFFKVNYAAVDNFYNFIVNKLYDSPTDTVQILSKGTFYSRKAFEKLKKIKDITDSYEVALKARAFYFPPFEPAYFMAGNKKFYITPANIAGIREGRK